LSVGLCQKGTPKQQQVFGLDELDEALEAGPREAALIGLQMDFHSDGGQLSHSGILPDSHGAHVLAGKVAREQGPRDWVIQEVVVLKDVKFPR
jgi:hypothetical protein